MIRQDSVTKRPEGGREEQSSDQGEAGAEARVAESGARAPRGRGPGAFGGEIVVSSSVINNIPAYFIPT